MRGDNGSCGEYPKKASSFTTIHLASPSVVGGSCSSTSSQQTVQSPVSYKSERVNKTFHEAFPPSSKNSAYQQQNWLLVLANSVQNYLLRQQQSSLEFPIVATKLGLGEQQGSSAGAFITDKRRIHRLCGFFAFLFTLFLVLSSVLETEVEVVPSPFFASTSSFGYHGQEDFESTVNNGRFQSVKSSDVVPSQRSFGARIKRLPQSIIIGARKCGTRALIDMLNLHPQVKKMR